MEKKATPRPAEPGSVGRRLLLVALGLLAGLAAAEVLLRATDLAPEVSRVRRGRFQLSPNPKIGYEPVPSFEYHGPLDSFYDYAGKSNRLGFRDRDHPVETRPGVFRILVLGDSVAAGQGVSDYRETFPALLERGLNDRGLPAEVLNFAVTGYNTQQEVETLKDKGLAFRPDLVLLAYCLNDDKRSDGWILPTLLEQERGAGGLVASRLDPRLMGSALYRFVRFHSGLARRPVPIVSGDTRREAFDLLGRLSREHGFRVLVAVFPRFGKILDYRWSAEHREVAALAAAAGLPLLDLLEPFQACRRVATEPLAADRFHPTAYGHGCAARALTGYIAGHRRQLGAP